MSISFQQTDTGGDCAVAVLCSGLTLAGTPMTSNKAIANGTAGINRKTATLAGGTTQKIAWMLEIDPTGFTVPAGNWTVRINITTAASVSGSQLTAIYICQVSSACANKATIASSTGLTTSITSTGVKTFVMTGSAVTLAAGDHIEIIIVFKNGSSSKTMTVSATPNQIIDTPLTVVTTSSWQQTDDSGVCGSTTLCDGLPNLTAIPDVAAVGGTAGVRTNVVTMPNGTRGLSFSEIDPSGYTCPAGNWLVQFNVTVAALNATTVIDSCYICQIGSNCANKATIASATGLAITLNSTGVKTVVLAGMQVALVAGDLIEIVLGLRTLATSDSISFVSDQIIGAPCDVVVGNIYDVDTSLDVTMAETPALALARVGALTLGATFAQSDVSKLDAVGAAMLAATFSHSSASLWNGARAIGTLTATLGCSTASALAGVIYDVAAGTMTVTFGQTSVTQRNAVAAVSLGATMAESTAAWTARQGALTLPVTMGEQTASQGNVTSSALFAYHPTVSTASQANTFSATSLGATVSISTLSAVGAATYNVAAQLAFTAGIGSVQPRLDAVARASFAATMAFQNVGLKTVTSSAALALTMGFSTFSAIAAATYDKATSFAFTAGLSSPQPRLSAVGAASFGATFTASSASLANRLADVALPVVPGLTTVSAREGATLVLATEFAAVPVLSVDGFGITAALVGSIECEQRLAPSQFNTFPALIPGKFATTSVLAVSKFMIVCVD